MVDHYKRAEELLDSYNKDERLEGIGHAILALVDELAEPEPQPGRQQPVPKKKRESGSWQS